MNLHKLCETVEISWRLCTNNTFTYKPSSFTIAVHSSFFVFLKRYIPLHAPHNPLRTHTRKATTLFYYSTTCHTFWGICLLVRPPFSTSSKPQTNALPSRACSSSCASLALHCLPLPLSSHSLPQACRMQPAANSHKIFNNTKPNAFTKHLLRRFVVLLRVIHSHAHTYTNLLMQIVKYTNQFEVYIFQAIFSAAFSNFLPHFLRCIMQHVACHNNGAAVRSL